MPTQADFPSGKETRSQLARRRSVPGFTDPNTAEINERYRDDPAEYIVAKSNSLQDATPTSATFCVTDDLPDRDGDRVNPLGVQYENWAKNGAPFFFGHQPESHPLPIGTGINPKTGKLDFWPSEHKILARCHFDMEDPFAAHVARKVKAGLLRGSSIAFVPISATRRDPENSKAWPGQYRANALPIGHDFHACDLTEISIVGVSANPRALLVDAPPEVAKQLRKCLGCRPITERHLAPEVVDALYDMKHSFRKYIRKCANKAADYTLGTGRGKLPDPIHYLSSRAEADKYARKLKLPRQSRNQKRSGKRRSFRR